MFNSFVSFTMKFSFTYLILVVSLIIPVYALKKNIFGSGQNVPIQNQTLSTPEECARQCESDEEPKTCYYQFTVEYFSTLSNACQLCRSNTTTRLTPDCQCITADGFEVSGVITVNRMYPGPSVMVCLNDYVIVDVVNHVPGNGITIHWHGIFQKGYQYYDGVPFVTQCPIVEGTTFRYQWKAQHPGTHFWHSHAGLQKGDGLEGALIIRQPKNTEPHNELWDVDGLDNVIYLSDWFHDSAQAHFPGTVVRNPGQLPDNFLINGLGQWTDPATGITTTTPLANMTIKAGQRYRFRMINSCSFTCPVQLTIQGHNLTLIAIDGQPVNPVVVTSIISSSAERYDFVLNATQTPGHYWIQVRGFAECADLKLQQLASLSYEFAPTLPELSKPSYDVGLPLGVILNPFNVRCDVLPNATNYICVNQLESTLPVPEEIFKTKPDVQLYWPFGFYIYELQDVFKPGTYNRFVVATKQACATVGNISNVFPPSPYISQRENIPDEDICFVGSVPERCSHTNPCTCCHVQKVPLNATVEIILIDEAHIPVLSHPFHIHGYAFYIMGEGRGVDHNITRMNREKVKELDRQGKLKRNFNNPPAKDTYAVPNNGYTILRIVANNPGYWLFHCHFLFHLSIGMGLVLQVGEPSDLPPVPTGFPKCGNFVPPITN